MEILKSSDKRLKNYGRLITDIDLGPAIDELSKLELPEAVAYVPSVEALESTSTFKAMKSSVFGEGEIEFGYCIGHNTLLNCVEYHTSSEVNVFATDAILILGKREDINDDNTYDTSKMEAFAFKKGEAVELYATALHYAPASVEGFKVGVVLPYGTNFELKEKHDDKLLTAANKWLIAHPEASEAKTSVVGLIGDNLDITK